MSFLFDGFSPSARAQIHDAAIHLRAFLRSEGIRLSPSSRFARYINALESDSDRSANGQPDISPQLSHRAHLEIDDLRLIAQYLPEIPSRHDWRIDFQRLIKGAALPAVGSRDTRARDFQFEFVTAAMLRRAGFDVERAEPDIIIRSTPSPIAVAAKRLVSPNSLVRQCQRAVRQIRASGLDGVVVVDVTDMIYDPNLIVQAESFRDAHFTVSEAVSERLRSEAPGIRRRLDPRTVIALIFYVAVLVRANASGDVGYVRGWTFANLCDAKDPRWATVAHIAERVNAASFLRAE
jgi:hypothetical protein